MKNQNSVFIVFSDNKPVEFVTFVYDKLTIKAVRVDSCNEATEFDSRESAFQKAEYAELKFCEVRELFKF